MVRRRRRAGDPRAASAGPQAHRLRPGPAGRLRGPHQRALRHPGRPALPSAAELRRRAEPRAGVRFGDPVGGRGAPRLGPLRDLGGLRRPRRGRASARAGGAGRRARDVLAPRQGRLPRGPPPLRGRDRHGRPRRRRGELHAGGQARARARAGFPARRADLVLEPRAGAVGGLRPRGHRPARVRRRLPRGGDASRARRGRRGAVRADRALARRPRGRRDDGEAPPPGVRSRPTATAACGPTR